MRASKTFTLSVWALLVGLVTPLHAQNGPGLSAQPRNLIAPRQPFTTIDTDEDAQARRVFRSRLWHAFLDTLARESDAPPDTELLVAACRRSISYSRLTSTELLVDGCISDAIDRVDRAGSYLNPRQYASAQREQRRPAGSMGLELPSIKRQDEPLHVVGAIAGGPAAKAGIQGGDLIETIDQVSVRNLSHEATIDAIRGEPGSVANVTLMRDGKVVEARVGREVVRPKMVRTKRLGPDALYVRILRFHSGLVAAQLPSEVLSELAAQPRPKLWILDLRRNTGGALSEVVATASLFVNPASPLFSVSSRSGPKIYSASSTDDNRAGELRAALAGVPLVVLVDGGTGSGAEALARVLREHLSAQVVGEPTAKIDNVLQSFDLLGEAAIQITIGYIASSSDHRRYSDGVPLDLTLASEPSAEFGSLPEDSLLAVTLEHFAK
ncbi:S41 family peptidase [Pseudorhodoferax sp.]|uniref:S41 family peptidase n=1 Tax=Pseudorhodoferax sp. TaxID=1993553 RepID=UPI002DD62C00|nr:S41 family peptidase [Pseudorhodoferax sp.]